HDIHRHHDERYDRHGDAALLGAQDQKHLADARQGEHGADADHPPVIGGESHEALPADRVDASCAAWALGFAHADHQQQHGEYARDAGDPEYGAAVVGPEKPE